MTNAVVLITGASSGIGEALALEFARQGSRVVLGARNLTELQRVAGAIRQQGSHPALVQVCDVTQRSDCDALVQAAIRAYGQLDVVIANAGMTQRARFEAADLDALRRVFEVNFWGALHTIQPALPHVKARKGSIVGISSIAGYRGLPGRTAYSGSKFALNGFLEVLRTELLHDGVHVLTACPGFTQSKIRENALTADGRTYQDVAGAGRSYRDESAMVPAAEVARDIYQAVVRRQRDLVLTRQGKLAVWVNKLFPSLADKLVLKSFQREAGAVV